MDYLDLLHMSEEEIEAVVRSKLPPGVTISVESEDEGWMGELQGTDGVIWESEFPLLSRTLLLLEVYGYLVSRNDQPSGVSTPARPTRRRSEEVQDPPDLDPDEILETIKRR